MAITAIRTVVIYIFIIAAMRIMGKRQLGELQPAELVVTLLIADLAAVPMQESGIPLLNGLIPILLLIALELLFSALMLKVPFFHRLFGGRPKIIVTDGHIDRSAMKSLRLTTEDLMETLRQQNVFDITQVEYAIVEANGKMSVLLKPAHRPVTPADLNIPTTDNGLPMVVISDGEISLWGLEVCGLDVPWVNKTLRKHNCTVEDVFLLTADRTRQYHLVKKEDAP